MATGWHRLKMCLLGCAVKRLAKLSSKKWQARKGESLGAALIEEGALAGIVYRQVKEMTKQEEIREGLRQKFYSGTVNRVAVADAYEYADRILSYLHSQGVAIRVDRELPQNPNKALSINIDKNPKKTWDVAHSYGWRDGWVSGRDDTIEAGYVAVEPLLGNHKGVVYKQVDKGKE